MIVETISLENEYEISDLKKPTKTKHIVGLKVGDIIKLKMEVRRSVIPNRRGNRALYAEMSVNHGERFCGLLSQNEIPRLFDYLELREVPKGHNHPFDER